MSQHLTSANVSPFDALRKTDEHGEFWTGRELIDHLGYLRWERFEDAIERGRAALAANGQDPDMHISGFAAPGNGVGAGATRSDYRMTREGVYATIQGADPRKPEIAAAWAYFRTKTREAEVARPGGGDLNLLRGMIDEIERDRARVAALETQQAEIISRQSAIEQRTEILEENHDRVAAIGYASLRKIRTDVHFLNRLGRRAAQIAKRDSIPASKVHSAIWGEVNAWPIEVWDEALEHVSTVS